MNWYDIVMTEYKALRDEILTSMKNQQSVLNFGLASVGALVLAAATAWERVELVSIISMALLPIISYIILIIWIGELERLVRAGYMVRQIEIRINSKTREKALSWEGWMRGFPGKKNRMLTYNYTGVIILFYLIAVSSIALGNIKLINAAPLAIVIIIDEIEFAAILLFTLFMLKTRRHIYKYREEYADE